MSKKYWEKFYRCPVCGKDELISALRQTRCPNCASTKVPQEEELFSRKEITDSIGLELAKGGPHWTCSNCGSINLSKHDHCDGCGNQRDGEDSTNQVRVLDHLPASESESPIKKEAECPKDQIQTTTNFPVSDGESSTPNVFDFSSSGIPDQQTVFYDVHTKNVLLNKLRLGSNFNWRIILVVLAIVVVLGGLGFLIFHTNNYSGQVIEFSWQRNISIEEYQVFHESNWDYSPSGAYNIIPDYRFYASEPIYETKTRQVYVSSHHTVYTDNGNGSSSSEDVDDSHWNTETYQELTGYRDIYKWYYIYDINRWAYTRSVVTKDKNRDPYWGNYTLRYNDQTIIGAEKVASTSETYLVYFQVLSDKEVKTFSISATQDDWGEYVIGNSYTLKVNHFSAVTNNPLREK